MRISKRFFFFIVFLFILFTGIIAGYLFLNQNKKIQVINNSKYYKIKLESSQILEKELSDWRVFKKNAIRINNGINTYTVNKIQIILTDQKQDLYQVTAKLVNGRKDIISSTGLAVNEKNNAVIIKIYLRPNIMRDVNISPTARTTFLNGLVLSDVIGALYNSTHSTITLAGKQDQILTELKKFYAAYEVPFVVTELNIQ